MKLSRVLLGWGPVIIWMAVIYYLSSQPGLRVAEGAWDFWTRKPAHIFVYCVLYLLIRRAFGFKRTFESLVFTLLYGVSDEFHQIFVPNRTGKVIDLILDFAGGVLGIFIWIAYQNLPKKLKILPESWLKV